MMPYYGDSLSSYYYGGPFSNHSSLMTGTARVLHTPLSRFSPHLSTISESPLSNLRRYSPVTTVSSRPRRVIDTADIDVSTPRILGHDNNRPHNRLRRDRPTIKIRSQALKDNPALREHNARHEKSVGELLVEKFLIKDKKLEESESPTRVFHQVSLDLKDDEEDLQVVKSKITRRFTRRRSSADIQLDPEQLEREVAYAQVQAEVLDNLVAEEQAEIENEVRRGTLIRKGTIARAVPVFFRHHDRDSVSQEEDGAQEKQEEAAAPRIRKTLKKVKKKKKCVEKATSSGQEEMDSTESRRSSSSSDVSGGFSSNDREVGQVESLKPQMFKIEACNSVGDLPTILVKTSNDGRKVSLVEQFRESVKISAPKRSEQAKKENFSRGIAEIEETQVILPAKKTYVKDTSRNSVHFTVKTPTDILKDDPLKKQESMTVNGIEGTLKNAVAKKETNEIKRNDTADKSRQVKVADKRFPGTKLVKDANSAKDLVDGKQSKETSLSKDSTGTGLKRIEADIGKEVPLIKDIGIPRLKKDIGVKSSDIAKLKPKIKPPMEELSRPESGKKIPKKEEEKASSKEIPKLNKSGEKVERKINVEAQKQVPSEEPIEKLQDSTEKPKRAVASNDTSANGASAVLAASSSSSMCLPKPSKINTDENNAVEAPELSLGEAAYLAKPTKFERDEDVVRGSLPGKTTSDIATLAETSISSGKDDSKHVGFDEESLKEKERGEKAHIGCGGTNATKLATKTTLLKGPRKEARKIAEKTEPDTKTELDVKSDQVSGDSTDLRKYREIEVEKRGGGEVPKKISSKGGPEKNLDGRTILSGETTLTKLVEAEDKEDTDKEVGKTSLRDGLINSGTSESEKTDVESKFPWKSKGLPRKDAARATNSNLSGAKESIDEARSNKAMSAATKKEPLKLVARKIPDSSKIHEESLREDANGALSKSTSTESIDFWSEIKAPDSPNVAKKPKVFRSGAKIAASLESNFEYPKELDKKKETDLKISGEPNADGFSDAPVIEEKRKLGAAELLESKTEEKTLGISNLETLEDGAPSFAMRKEPRNKRNLLISIDSPEDAYSTVKKAPFKRENSGASTISANSSSNTPNNSLPNSEVSTPVSEFPVPLISIFEVPTLAGTDSKCFDDDDEPVTPTNDLPESGLARITKWSNHADLSSVDEPGKDVATPAMEGKEASSKSTPGSAQGSTKKKKTVKKKKSSTKSSATKSSTKKKTSTLDKDEKAKKESSWSQENLSLKPPDRKSSPRNSPRNTPTKRPIDLIKMFYTTPTALLTATPRDLSKVRRAKIKRRKHQSRTPSVSSDSTGSTTSTATTESTDGSGSTCTELDDDPEHKRMNSTRSNDSGFDGSPRISNCDMVCHKKCEKLTGNLCGLNQKLVAEALQALKRAPSQSSDTQRNSDSSDHFPSGRITPPATNLPRFKKYAVTDFNFLKVLGKGSFGKVLLAELHGTECVYAVKCLKKDVVLEDDDVECTLIERKVLTLATRHPYLCHLFCTFQTDSHLFFVMEYLNGGDLMFHIQKSGRFPEPRARFYAAEIWSGLNFLHKKGIVYRDLKLDNVLLDYEGHIRIADFGMCKLQIFLDRTADTFCGTPDYMAPEIIKGLKYNQAVDWWSYGVLMYEMLTGQSPFSGCDEDELFWSICNERPFIPRYLSQESTDILVCLLEKDSGKRLPGHEISMHPFFQSLPWDRLERRQLEAPFKPAVDHTLDTRYFDTAFTAERPRLTPVPEQILTSMDQGVFRGFSYTNPNATD